MTDTPTNPLAFYDQTPADLKPSARRAIAYDMYDNLTRTCGRCGKPNPRRTRLCDECKTERAAEQARLRAQARSQRREE